MLTWQLSLVDGVLATLGVVACAHVKLIIVGPVMVGAVKSCNVTI